MDRDEQAIRALVATWLEATAAGDLPRVLELMADDVVFLGPGRPTTRGKEGFAAAVRAMQGRHQIRGTAEVQEIRVFGDWTYCWNHITVTNHPAGDGAPIHLTGPALPVLRKNPDGQWVIFRQHGSAGAAVSVSARGGRPMSERRQ